MSQSDDPESQWIDDTLDRLSHSDFRAGFVLSAHDRSYADGKGRDVISRHARELLRSRVGDAHPVKDGRQTPWRGHPVFTAQHATATCCRSCIAKWHGIPQGRELTDEEISRLTDLVMAWIDIQMRTFSEQPDARSAQSGRKRSGRLPTSPDLNPTLF